MSNEKVVLDGWLFVHKDKIEGREIHPGQPEVVVYAHVLTKKKKAGGRHPVTLMGKPANFIRKFAKLVPGDTLSIRAMVEGELFTVGECSRVRARFVTFFGVDGVMANEEPVCLEVG
jgi:hypothetical protein